MTSLTPIRQVYETRVGQVDGVAGTREAYSSAPSGGSCTNLTHTHMPR